MLQLEFMLIRSDLFESSWDITKRKQRKRVCCPIARSYSLFDRSIERYCLYFPNYGSRLGLLDYQSGNPYRLLRLHNIAKLKRNAVGDGSNANSCFIDSTAKQRNK